MENSINYLPYKKFKIFIVYNYTEVIKVIRRHTVIQRSLHKGEVIRQKGQIDTEKSSEVAFILHNFGFGNCIKLSKIVQFRALKYFMEIFNPFG